jgi:hypothetical protein
MANSFSNLWQRRDRDAERHIIEHIRRNGYIGQESLGDMCITEGIGDRVPNVSQHRWHLRDTDRRRRLAEIEWEREWARRREEFFANVTQKHTPDF